MHIELNSQQIHVDVNRGQVVLAGTVADSYAKRIVGEIASQVVDMSAVRNELGFNDSVPVDIEPASTNEAPDPEATD
jgi:osmotically-inducible protein OsmY